MSRFDIGVVVVTFVVLGVGAIIRNVVVPIVRFRISRYRLASNPIEQDARIAGLSAQSAELGRREPEFGTGVPLGGSPEAARVVKDERNE